MYSIHQAIVVVNLSKINYNPFNLVYTQIFNRYLSIYIRTRMAAAR